MLKTKLFLAIIMFQIFSVPVFVAKAQPAAANKIPPRFYWDRRPFGCLTNMNNYATQHPEKCIPEENWPTYAESKKRIQNLLNNADAEDLPVIQMAEDSILAQGKKKFATGEYVFEPWTESMAYQFSSAYRFNPEFTNPRAKFIDAWVDYQKGQGYSAIAKAMAYYGKATDRFNSRYPKNNSPGVIVNYAKYLLQANKMLDAASAQIKKTAVWYEYKLKIVYQHPQLKAGKEKLLKQAAKAWPTIPDFYAIAYAYSNPRWGGSAKKMRSILKAAVDKTKSKLGVAMYPQVIFKARLVQYGFEIPFQEIDWPLMKQGFQDYQKYYSGNSYMYFWFLNTACKMGDKKEALRLFPLYEKFKQGEDADVIKACRTFAFSKGGEKAQPGI